MSKTDSTLAISTEVARLLHRTRVNQNFSMTQLAKQCGLSQQMISYVERGMRKPTLDTLLRIAGVLEVDLWKLLKTADERAATKTSRVKRTTRKTTA